MPGKDNKNGENGGNGGGAKPVPLPPEVRKARLYNIRKAQYFLLKLASILNYEPAEKAFKNPGFAIDLDGFHYDLGEIFEKAVKVLDKK